MTEKPQQSGKQEKSGDNKALRPARADEIHRTHKWLMQAIEESPYYNDLFKTHECARMTIGYLRLLHEADPAHLMVVQNGDEPVGFMISSPECGSLWLHWSYVLPEKRRATIVMAATRNFSEYWDNGRFHKIATYTMPGNDAATAILNRYGYKEICKLQNHIFGEDYLLYERPLTKITPDYDGGIANIGLLGRIVKRIKALVSKS